MEEKISVVIPVYKVEKHLPRCLRSIEEQTVFSALDVILVDDGSPDASGAICDEFVARHANARVIHKQNGGVSSARNAGLDAATEKYVGFVDADDFLRRDAMEIALSHLREGAEGVFFRTVNVLSDEEVPAPDARETLFLEGPEVHRAILLRRNGVFEGVPKIYRRDVVGDTRFPEELRIGEDMLFLFRVLCRLRRAVIPAPGLYFYRNALNPSDRRRYPEDDRFAAYEEVERLTRQTWPELASLAQARKMDMRRYMLLGMLVVPERVDNACYRNQLRALRREIVPLLKNPERALLPPKHKAHAVLLCVCPPLARLWCMRRRRGGQRRA